MESYCFIWNISWRSICLSVYFNHILWNHGSNLKQLNSPESWRQRAQRNPSCPLDNDLFTAGLRAGPRSSCISQTTDAQRSYRNAANTHKTGAQFLLLEKEKKRWEISWYDVGIIEVYVWPATTRRETVKTFNLVLPQDVPVWNLNYSCMVSWYCIFQTDCLLYSEIKQEIICIITSRCDLRWQRSNESVI